MKPVWEPDLPEDRPTGAQPARKQVKVIRAGEPETSAILLGRPECARVHWIEAKHHTRPCTTPQGVHCDAGMPYQRSYYVSAVVWERDRTTGTDGWHPRVLLLTKAVRYSLGPRAQRGTLIGLSRSGERPNAAVSVRV